MNRRHSLVSWIVALVLLAALRVPAQNAPVQLEIDARDVPRKVLHAHMRIPAKPGPLTLMYPKWIPGEHGPTGPIINMTGLKLSADGKPVTWRRDPEEMYALHLDVPPGANEVIADFDFLYGSSGAFGAGAAATTQLVVLSWNHALLYPKGSKSDDLTYSATLRLPQDWQFGTSLPVSRSSGDSITFQPVSLTRLVDSPVAAGKYFKRYPIGEDRGRPHYIDLVADSAEALTIPDNVLAGYKNLVGETGALFGARHYGQYHFLYVLSDHIAQFGLEHHESSEDRTGERTLLDENQRKLAGTLLTHEFSHSWNGKFRRPAGLATPSYEQPMKGELLWVYEGLTTYLGDILAPRSSLNTPEEFREQLAGTASQMARIAGRKWRPLADTAVEAQLLYVAPQEWTSARRGVDFYPEGTLIWLEADTLIRQKTAGQKSLDDFCRLFYGGESGPPQVKPYTVDDVTSALNKVAPYDWKGFFQKRVYEVRAEAPLEGIENSGWHLIYNETPNEMQKNAETAFKFADFSLTLGLSLNESGAVNDLVPESAAAKAGISPGFKVVGVNGRKYTAERLHSAVKESKGALAPIVLLVEDGDYQRSLNLDYHDGERFPHLERFASRPDLLSEIIKPHATSK